MGICFIVYNVYLFSNEPHDIKIIGNCSCTIVPSSDARGISHSKRKCIKLGLKVLT